MCAAGAAAVFGECDDGREVTMSQILRTYAARFCGCAALLALLAVSSMNRERQRVPNVPVLLETVSDQVLAVQTVEQTRNRLTGRREEALSLLQSVLDDPHAGEGEKNAALEEKTKIAGRMETEASVEALLAHMGFTDTIVVVGETSLSIIAPWQNGENEHNRIQMIDAAVSQSGLAAEAVKIILAKK